MDRLKRILLRMIDPPDWLAALIVFPSFGLLLYVFLAGYDEHWLGYTAYGLSAYALVVMLVQVPGVIRAFRNGFQAHPLVRRAVESELGSRYRSDALYRAELSLYSGLVINLLYAVVKLVMGVAYHSLWFIALAGYYLLLAGMRFALAHHIMRNPAGEAPVSEWKRYRLCGAVLLMMNQALAVVVALVVYRSSAFRYPGILIYVMAMYTFYAFTIAIINMVKYRGHFSPVIAAAKAVSLVAALVSMLSLETAMIAQFGDANNETFRRTMTALTGFAVCTAVLALAVYMLVHATRKLRGLRTVVREEKKS